MGTVTLADLPLFAEGRYPVSPAGIDADFERFHEANPHVYREIVGLCRKAKSRGLDHWSINGIFEVLRWKTAIKTDEEAPRLNNNYRALYARLVMKECPDLEGFFETRERRDG